MLLLYLLGRQDATALVKTAASLGNKQASEGGWRSSAGNPKDLSTSVTAYLALRVHGVPSEAPYMQRAAAFIKENGGVDTTDVFTRSFLALFGCCPSHCLPSFFPEMMCLSSWTGNAYHTLPAWLRGLALPAAVARTCASSKTLPDPVRLDELIGGNAVSHTFRSSPFIPKLIFLLLTISERVGLTPWRNQALQAADEWLHGRCSESDGPGASATALIWLLIALHFLGVEASHPDMVRPLESLNELFREEKDALHLQPYQTPVWDTAHAQAALCSSGLDPGGEAVLQAAAWLVDQEITSPGEWQAANPNVRSSGWARTFNGRWYPDIANTARVLQALQFLHDEGEGGAAAHGLISRISVQGILDDNRLGVATQRGLAWLLSMQNPDGGWGYWDRMRKMHVAPPPPFCDTPDAVDLSTAESTALSLSALSGFGYNKGAPVVKRAVVFLKNTQNRDGYWEYPRFNAPIYTTWCVLEALQSVKEDTKRGKAVKAAEWLRDLQNPDGGWGGPVCTAWAIMGLMAQGDVDQQVVVDGVAYLVDTQRSDGAWQDETAPTPRAPGLFSFTDDLGALYFPLMALGKYRQTL